MSQQTLQDYLPAPPIKSHRHYIALCWEMSFDDIPIPDVHKSNDTMAAPGIHVLLSQRVRSKSAPPVRTDWMGIKWQQLLLLDLENFVVDKMQGRNSTIMKAPQIWVPHLSVFWIESDVRDSSRFQFSCWSWTAEYGERSHKGRKPNKWYSIEPGIDKRLQTTKYVRIWWWKIDWPTRNLIMPRRSSFVSSKNVRSMSTVVNWGRYQIWT